MTDNNIVNGERLDAFPLRSGTRKGCPPNHSFSVVLEVLAGAISQKEKKEKERGGRKEGRKRKRKERKDQKRKERKEKEEIEKGGGREGGMEGRKMRHTDWNRKNKTICR